MIAYVSGTLADKKPTRVIVDVQGLGYMLHIPASSYATLPPVGKPVKLRTYHHVREDALLLFGFATEAERQLFETMIGVSGVGPKLALAALSAMNPGELYNAIVGGEAGMLTRIPGVGRKTAERLVVELRDRLVRLDLSAHGTSAGGGSSPEQAQIRGDALAALETLGLSRAMAEKNLRKAMRNNPGTHTSEQLVRLALREA